MANINVIRRFFLEGGGGRKTISFFYKQNYARSIATHFSPDALSFRRDLIGLRLIAVVAM